MVIINFLPRDTKLVNSAVHMESPESGYVCFPNQDVFRVDK